MPERIQRQRVRGWRMPENAISVARPSKWGNPFIIGRTIGCDDREDAVALHRGWLEYGHTAPYPHPGESARLADLRERLLADARELIGKDLACWCPLDQPCHADALLDLANYFAANPAA